MNFFAEFVKDLMQKGSDLLDFHLQNPIFA